MAEIAMMFCAVSSLAASVGGGFYFMKQEEKKALEEERIAEIEEQVADSTKFVGYPQCEYKGGPMILGTEDVPEGTLEVTNPTIKSLIIPVGFKVDTYAGPGKAGVKMSYSGPTKMKCINVPYLEWTRV